MKGVFMRGFYALFMRLASTILVRRLNWSEWRDLNPRPLAPQSRGHKNTSHCPAVVFLVFALPCLPAYAQSIYLDHRGGQLPESEINYAAWLISERRGMDLAVVGTTELGCIANSIVMRRAQWTEWLKLPYKWQGADAVAAECDARSVVIVFSPQTVIYQSLIQHEMLHASSCWGHSANPNDALDGNALGPFSIGYEDATCPQIDPIWPTSPSPCFAELAPNMTLYIPAIGGARARLAYEGVIAGFHQWSAPVVAPTSGVCTGFAISGNIATLPDVRAYPDKRYTAKLEKTNEGKWKLTELTQ